MYVKITLIFYRLVSGLLWRQFVHDDGLEPEAWVYASVVVPIVVTMSPVGALISSYLHRQVIASFLYVLDTVAIVSIVIVLSHILYAFIPFIH
jgi:hypothetical protein